MDNFSKEEIERRKKAVFTAMSARRQKHIAERIGYEKWDPFQEPKDPIDIRRAQSKRTTHQLVREFLHSRTLKEYSNAYGAGVLEICLGLMNDDDRYRAMFEFSCWYRNLLDRGKAGRD